MSKASFESAIKHTNDHAATVVKDKYNKVFLATGVWPKKFNKHSAGGSFYHPEIPGVMFEDSWGVHIAASLARLQGSTTDSMQFTFCHELGHHIFGSDREVEADNFAP